MLDQFDIGDLIVEENISPNLAEDQKLNDIITFKKENDLAYNDNNNNNNDNNHDQSSRSDDSNNFKERTKKRRTMDQLKTLLTKKMDTRTKLYEPTDREVYAFDIGLFLDKNSNEYILKNDIPTIIYDNVEVFSASMFKTTTRCMFGTKKNEKVYKEIIETLDFMKQIDKMEAIDLPTLIKIRFDIYKRRFNSRLMGDKIRSLLLWIRLKLARSTLIKLINKRLEADSRDYVGAVLTLITSGLEISSSISDVLLLVALYELKGKGNLELEYTTLFIIRLFAVASHYLISYSSGIQLLISKGCYEPSEFRTYPCWKKFFLILNFTCVSPLFFVFLSVFDIWLNIVIALLTLFVFKNEHFYYLAGKIESLVDKLGLSDNEYEGILQQRRIGQLLFQNLILLIFNTLILTGNIEAPGLLETSFSTLLTAYALTIINVTKMFSVLYIQARFFREDFLTYSFHTMKAKFDWIPFLDNVRNGTIADKIVDYYFIRSAIPMVTQLTGITENFTFEFTDIAVNKIQEVIAYLNINRLPGDPIPKLRIGRCIHHIPLPTIGHLISVLLNDTIEVDFFGANWENCIKLAFEKKIITVDEGNEGKWKALTPIGESIISLIIMTEKEDKFELEPLLEALINNGADLDICDSKDFTPLTLAIKYRKLRSVHHLLEGDCQVNYPDIRADEYPLDIALENAFTDNGNTPPEKDLEIITALLKNNADPYKNVKCNNEKKAIFLKALEYILRTDAHQFTIKFPILKLFIEHGCKTRTGDENIVLLEAIAYMRSYHEEGYFKLLEHAIPDNINFYELTDHSNNTFTHLFFRYLNEKSTFEDLKSFYPEGQFNFLELLCKKNNQGETPISHSLKYAVDLMKLFEFDVKAGQGDHILQYFRNCDDILVQNIVPYISNFLLQEDDGPLNCFEDFFFNEINLNNDIETMKAEIKNNLSNSEGFQGSGKKIKKKSTYFIKSRDSQQVKKFEKIMKKVLELDPSIRQEPIALKKLEVKYNITIKCLKDENEKSFFDTFHNTGMKNVQRLIYKEEKKKCVMSLNHTKPLLDEILQLASSKIQYDALKPVNNSLKIVKIKKQVEKKGIGIDHLINLLIQIISFADFSTDITITYDLMQMHNREWISIAVICIAGAYLVSYAPLISFFIERKSFKIQKKSKKIQKIKQVHKPKFIELDQKTNNVVNNQVADKLRSSTDDDPNTHKSYIINSSLLIDPNLIISKMELPPFEESIQKEYKIITQEIEESTKNQKLKQCFNSFLSGLIKWTYAGVFLTPICLIYFCILDVLYLIVEVTVFTMRILASIITFGACTDLIDPDIIPKAFNKLFKLNDMDVKGLRKLRTISQLIFESIPMIILQVFVLDLKEKHKSALIISRDNLYASIGLAIFHGLLELSLLYSEAKASSAKLSYYSIVCLNGRLNWVPYTEKITDDILKEVDKRRKIPRSLTYSHKTQNEQSNSNPESGINSPVGGLISSELINLNQNGHNNKHIKLIIFERKTYNYGKMVYPWFKKLHLVYRFYESTINILGNCFTNMPLAKKKSELFIINLANTCECVSMVNMLALLKLGYGKVQIKANWHQIIENNFPTPPTSQPLDSDGEYMLITLVQTECIDGLKPFLEKVKHLDSNVASIKNGKSLAVIAVENKTYDILNLLIRYDVDISQLIKNKNIIMKALDDPHPSNFCLLVNLLSHPKVVFSFRRKLQALDTIRLLYSQKRKAEAFLLTDLLGGLFLKIYGENLIDLMNVNFDEDITLPEQITLIFDGPNNSNNNYHKSSNNDTSINTNGLGNNNKYFNLDPVSEENFAYEFDLKVLQNFRGLRCMLPGISDLINNTSKVIPMLKEKLCVDSKRFIQLYNIITKEELPVNFGENEFDLKHFDNLVESFGLDNEYFFNYFHTTGILREELEIKVNFIQSKIKQKFASDIPDVPYLKHEDLFQNICQIRMPDEALALKSIKLEGEVLLTEADYFSIDMLIQTQYDCCFEPLYSFSSNGNKINILFDGKENKLNMFNIPMKRNKLDLYLVHSETSKLIKFGGSITITLYVVQGFGRLLREQRASNEQRSLNNII